MLLAVRLKACFIVVFAFGCSGGSSGGEGELGGSCSPDSTCDTGLDCVGDVCESGGTPDGAILDAAVFDGAILDAAVPDAAMACAAAADFQYVISALTVPANASAANNLGQDIDGDGLSDNALGGLFGALSSTADLDVQTPTDEQVATGDFIQLLNIAADDLNSAGCAAILTYQGDSPAPTPCTNPADLATCSRHLQGTASFGIASSTPTSSAIEGNLSGGVFATSSTSTPATAFVAISMTTGVPIILELFEAKIATNVSSGALTTGKIGGGISVSQVDTVVLPALNTSLQVMVAEDCSLMGNDCGCQAGSPGEQVLAFFDTNSDCQLPLQEFTSNALIDATIRSPDLDLLDGNGLPGTDGVADHLSVGLGFSATTASF